MLLVIRKGRAHLKAPIASLFCTSSSRVSFYYENLCKVDNQLDENCGKTTETEENKMLFTNLLLLDLWLNSQQAFLEEQMISAHSFVSPTLLPSLPLGPPSQGREANQWFVRIMYTRIYTSILTGNSTANR